MSWSQNVFSSNVSNVAFEDEVGLVVTFKNGKRYAYEGVPEDVALQLANAPSVGSMLNDQIKGRYGHRKL